MKQKKTLSLSKNHIFIWGGVFFFFSLTLWASFSLFSFFSKKNKALEPTVQKNTLEGTRYRDTIYPNIRVQSNVEYSRIQNKKLLLDVYQPENDTESQRAALIWVHGGGFFYGNKERMKTYAREFAGKGFVSVAINYQLGEKDLGTQDGITTHSVLDFPTIIEAQQDAQTAVRWLKAHAYDYQINPDLIFIGGESAGGIIALLVGYNSENAPEREYATYSPKVAGVISIAGTSDSKIISPDDPPLIMFQGEEDTIIQFSRVKKFQDSVKKSHLISEFYNYPSLGHDLAEKREEIFSKTSLFLWSLIQE